MRSKTWLLAVLLIACPAWAQLSAMTESDLREQSGQGGVQLSGAFSINTLGGALWRTPVSNNPTTWSADQRSCAPSGAAAPQACGMRLGLRAQAQGGWYVLDNVKGRYSFEGLTVRTRHISSGFGNDGAGFDRQVVQIGLPTSLEVHEASMELAMSNQANWRNRQVGAAGADTSFRQNNLISLGMSGTLKTEGHLLIFPR